MPSSNHRSTSSSHFHQISITARHPCSQISTTTVSTNHSQLTRVYHIYFPHFQITTWISSSNHRQKTTAISQFPQKTYLNLVSPTFKNQIRLSIPSMLKHQQRSLDDLRQPQITPSASSARYPQNTVVTFSFHSISALNFPPSSNDHISS